MHLFYFLTYFDNGKGSMFYRNAAGKFIKNRRNVLAEMYLTGGFSREEIQYIRDGLVNEGWKYHQDLPVGWMFKQYTHKIEGVDTDVILLYIRVSVVLIWSLCRTDREKLNINLDSTVFACRVMEI